MGGAQHLGVDRAGADGVDEDAGGEFLGPAAHQPENAVFGGDIGREGLAPVIGHVGGDQDRAGGGLGAALHQADGGLADKEAAAQVDGDYPVEIGDRGFQQGGFVDDTGAVDQNVQPAEGLPNRLPHGRDGSRIGYVAGKAQNLRPGGAGRCGGFLRRADVGQRHPVAGAGKGQRAGGTDATPGAGNQDAPGHAITSPRSSISACPVMSFAPSEASHR